MIPLKANYIFFLFPILLATLCISCSKDEGEDPGIDDEEPIEFTGELSFIRNLGGAGTDDVAAVIQASDSNYVFVGTTESTDGDITDKTTDDDDIWVLKTDQEGNVLWSKTYGGSDDEQATSIHNTSDGGFIISAYTRSDDGDVSSGNAGFNDLWIVKLSSSGDLLWEKTHGFSGNDQAYNVIPTNNGGYFLIGVLDVSASGGQGNSGRSSGNRHAGGDYWAIQTDSNGNLIWSRYYGGSFTDTAYDVMQMDDGGFIITGTSDSSDVDIIDNKGAYDFWMLRIDSSGNFVWRKNFGGNEIDLGYAMTKTSDGNFIVVGDTRSNDGDISNLYGNADVWVVKFNPNGNIIWEKNYGGTEFESARNIATLPNGNFAIAASTRSNDIDLTSNFGVNDAWVFVIDGDGNLLYQQNFGGSNLDFANGITTTTSGEILMVGNTESSDGDLTQNKGEKDAFLLKIE